MFKVNVRLIALKLSRLTWEECGTCPDCTRYTLAFAFTTARKNTGKTCQGNRKVLVGHELMYWHGRLWRVARTSCLSRSPCYRGPASTLGQRRYLPSCVTKGFLTSTLSSVSQRSDVKKGTPKFSWTCLLPTLQGSLAAMQRHLDWSTCRFLIWERAMDLQTGHS